MIDLFSGRFYSFSLSKLVSGAAYFLVLFILVFWVFNGLVLGEPSPLATGIEKKVLLGISVVTNDASTVLNSSKKGENITKENASSLDIVFNLLQQDQWMTSFLLSSQGPSAQIYLDYIAIYGGADVADRICIKSIYLSKNDEVPVEVVLERAPENLTNSAEEYVYTFPSALCMTKDRKYIQPHLLIGILPVKATADIGIAQISGDRAFQFFPFDEQNIEISTSIDATFNGTQKDRFVPELAIALAEDGWTGELDTTATGKINLHLFRYPFHKTILYIFIFVMGIITLLLSSVIDQPASFFEVAFGLLLGLWGMHEILIPDYIRYSAFIDFVLYVMFILVMSQIMIVILREWGRMLINRKVQIMDVRAEDERVIIRNTGWLPVEITDWLLYDEAGNTYKFPAFILRAGQEINVVTEVQGQSANTTSTLFWHRATSVWNDNGDIAYLDDSNGVKICRFSYSG